MESLESDVSGAIDSSVVGGRGTDRALGVGTEGKEGNDGRSGAVGRQGRSGSLKSECVW